MNSGIINVAPVPNIISGAQQLAQLAAASPRLRSRDLSNEEIIRNVKSPIEDEPASDNASQANGYKTPDLLVKIKNFIHHPLINGILITGDILSAASDFKLFQFSSKALKNFIDIYSVRLTKAFMIARYFESGIAALKKNRVIESFGRLMGMVSLPLVKLHDLTMASGLGEFVPMLDLSLEGKVGKGREYKNGIENFQVWMKSLADFYKDMFRGGLGKSRKIFPDFNAKQVKAILGNMTKIITGQNNLKNLSVKDEGHTTTLAGTVTGLGALIGVVLGRKHRGLANKLGGTIRNIGGIIGDYVLLTHPDRKMNKAGIVFLIASIVDLVQRYLPEKYLNTINHLNIINTFIGAQIVSQRTHDKNDNKIDTY